MANNPFGGNSIRLDQVEKGLQEAKRSGHLHLDYSKIKCVSGVLIEAAEGKNQIAKYEIGDLLEKVRRECDISSRDIAETENILTGEN